MQIRADSFLMRPWQPGDEASLAEAADDRKVWKNLRSSFPHPYTLDDAREWIAECEREAGRALRLAIVVEGQPVGAIGVELGRGQQSGTGEIGYWLAVEHWGKGIASEAARLVTEYAFDNLNLARLEAAVLESNGASARVLEKAGFRQHGKLRKPVPRPGRCGTELLFSREHPQGGSAATEQNRQNRPGHSLGRPPCS